MPSRILHTQAAEQCALKLMETVPTVMQFIRTEMRSQREPSLSVPQFRVLIYLDRHPDASLSALADHLGVTRATASTTVDRLVRQGVVSRVEHPTERRLVMLKLTQEGSDRLTQLRQITRQKIAALLGDLSTQDLDNVTAGLELLSQVFTSAQ